MNQISSPADSPHIKESNPSAIPQAIMWKTVSEQCNLACKYCYYSHCQGQLRGGVQRIAPDLLQKVIREMMSAARGNATFLWQGGEPLLAGLPFFEQIVSFQAQYARPHTLIHNAIQTNGTLITRRWAAFFKRYAFVVGVSLDGPQHIHDVQRITSSGAGTYSAVMKGVHTLRAEGVDPNILMVLHEDNIQRQEELFDWMDRESFRHVQFIPCMSFTSQQSTTDSSYAISAEQYGTFLCRAFDWWYRGGRPEVSIRLFEDWLQQMLGLESSSCIHASSCPRVLVLDHLGNAYPCDFFIQPSFKLGNANTQTLAELNQAAAWEFFRQAKSDLPLSCKRCEYVHYCRGGCPRNRPVSDSSASIGCDYFCKSYRMLYAYAEDRMRLLAQRILSSKF